jgi:hypothetical protein
MGNQSDYFNKIGYQPTYHIGDRVFGHWKQIPFIGSVGNDTVINLVDGPRITIHLDLPIRIDGYNHNILVVQHQDIKKLKEF